MFAAAALGLVAAGPALLAKYFWAMRIDLLTLPLFAAAAIVLLPDELATGCVVPAG